jgi:Domain of unknown function (DUF4432)
VISGERLGHLDQVALATERPAVDAHVLAGIELRIHPHRGLDLGAAWFRGVPIAWIAPAGEGGADSTDWRAAWGGGLLTTCGLDNVGTPSEGIGLHGTYTFLPAHDVATERSRSQVVVRGAVVNELRVAIESDLPRLWQWIDPGPGIYALGIEPANYSVLGRAHDRSQGTLPYLEPGEERSTRIAITAEEME